jgi:hypothetical protein
MKFYRNSCSGNRADLWGQTDRRADLRNEANRHFFATVRTRLKIRQTFHVVEAAQTLKIGKRYQKYLLRDALRVISLKFELTFLVPM